jgi:hypothetical protein
MPLTTTQLDHRMAHAYFDGRRVQLTYPRPRIQLSKGGERDGCRDRTEGEIQSQLTDRKVFSLERPLLQLGQNRRPLSARLSARRRGCLEPSNQTPTTNSSEVRVPMPAEKAAHSVSCTRRQRGSWIEM